MRECIRCAQPMLEGYDPKVDGGGYGLRLTEPGFLKASLGKVFCAVCPACGYVELYLADTSKLPQPPEGGL